MPKKKASVKKTKKPAKKPAAPKSQKLGKKNIYLDYPTEGEHITSDYTFRVGTPEPVKWVEVSVNKGPWQSCRSAHGYWWCDWKAAKKGKHHVVARAEKEDGEVLKSNQRKFTADPQ